MKCDKCGLDFEEKDIQKSHDVPCYLFYGPGRSEREKKADKYGTHNLCKGCHYAYEMMVIGWMTNELPFHFRGKMINVAIRVSNIYFSKKEEIEDVNKS